MTQEMTQEIYITDTLKLKDNRMYMSDIPLTPLNWHHKLSDIGWAKMPRQWIMHLNTLSTCPFKNSQYGVLDCPEDGDCFFHCIANALHCKSNYMEHYESQDIREMICDYLSQDTYEILMDVYKSMKDSGDFQEQWDPYEIQDISDFKRVVIQGGHSYWGDHLLLQILCERLQINLKILTYLSPDYLRDIDDDCRPNVSIYPMMLPEITYYDTIILLHVNECHFKLVGHFNGEKMCSYFTNENVPSEINVLYKDV